MRVASALVLVLAVAGTASAQSAYVGASFIGDVVKASGSSYENGGGETFGGALRTGLPLGAQWGVELELARTGTIEGTPRVFPATVSIAPFDDPAIFPVPDIEVENQLSTISTMLWWSHDVGARVSLVYLGGVAFTRSASSFRIEYPSPLIPGIPGFPGGGGLPFLPRSIEHESTSYGADVAVGFEGRIGMTDHLRLTPGIRLQTVPGGWAIRPGIGLQWMF